MEQMKKENEEMIKIHGEISANESSKTMEAVDDFVAKFFVSQAICNKPKFVFWLSSTAQKECLRSQHDAYDHFKIIGDMINKDVQNQKYKDRLGKKINKINKIIITNSAYLN